MQAQSFSKENIFKLFLCALFAVTLSTAAQKAQAQSGTLPPSACDPEYMDAIEARAWLEAQREITMNANLILKPDSVLVYSCLGDWVNKFITQINGTVQFTPNLGAAAANSSGQSAIEFLSTNFRQNLLADKTDTLPAAFAGGDMCDDMTKAWRAAQCANFQQFSNEQFMTFDDLKSGNIRNLPDGTQPDPNDQFSANYAGAIGSGWCNEPEDAYDRNIIQAFNTTDTLDATHMGHNVGTPNTLYQFDPIVSSQDLIKPAANTSECQPPIFTGLTVRRSDGTTYSDGFCPNPGCMLKPNGTSACCVASLSDTCP